MQTQGLEGLEDYADARYALAIQGRHGDNVIGHLTPGEMVLPRPIADDPILKRELFNAFERHEVNPYQYTVGHYENSINPLTGVPEFGFFKKIGKFLKRAAPIIGSVIGFAVGGPGGSAALGSAIGGGIGGAVKEGNLEGALKGAAMGYVGGNIATGAGLTGGGGIGSLWGKGTKGIPSMWGTTATPAAAGNTGIGGFFQNVGANITGTGGTAGMHGSYIPTIGEAWKGLSGLQKAGAGIAGMGALGGAGLDLSAMGGREDAQMPPPSGTYGGYLEKALRGATLPTQYGTEGVQSSYAPQKVGFGEGLTGGILSPQQQAYLKATLSDEEYSNLMFPEFKRNTEAFADVYANSGGYVKDLDLRQSGGSIVDPGSSGNVDTVDAKLSDGEFVLTKDSVTGIGDGDHQKGIEYLYALMSENEKRAEGIEEDYSELMFPMFAGSRNGGAQETPNIAAGSQYVSTNLRG